MDYYWCMNANRTHFSNTSCEYFPCHGIENQNCLFCYCPLYGLDCGGNFTRTHGVKDCSACTLVHEEGGYAYVQERLATPFFSLGMPRWFRGFLASRQDDYSTPEGRMALAVALGGENIRQGTGGPFGAAIFSLASNELIACGVNRVEPEGSAVAHAEVMALALAQKRLGTYDLGAAGVELVTSSQPCTMCYGAAIWSGVRAILTGARREDVEKIAGFDEGPLPDGWIAELALRGITVSTDICRREACEVLRTYGSSGVAAYNSSANKLRPKSAKS